MMQQFKARGMDSNHQLYGYVNMPVVFIRWNIFLMLSGIVNFGGRPLRGPSSIHCRPRLNSAASIFSSVYSRADSPYVAFMSLWICSPVKPSLR